jgi:hypothetical protein
VDAALSSGAYSVATDLLREIRREKTANGRKPTWPVVRLRVQDAAERLVLLRSVEDDLRAAGAVTEFDWVEGGPAPVTVELAPVDA